MAEFIHIAASLRIDRPADEVRAQYRDIDHHIRNNVHPSIRYHWEPSAQGERKIRTTFRILGVPQFDISLLEDTDDGSFVIRYLEGSNAGMILVHQFVPLGLDATDVQLFADAPATVARKILGPLFVVGARQVMKKALAEDKRDLEKGKYVPDLAAGNVEGALAELSSVAKKGNAAARAVLEAAILVSACDGVIDPAEKDATDRLSKILRAEGDGIWVRARGDELARLSESDRIATEADRIGASLKATNSATEGIQAAAVIGLVSQGMSLGELAALRRIATSAGVPEEALGPIVDAADHALSAN